MLLFSFEKPALPTDTTRFGFGVYLITNWLREEMGQGFKEAREDSCLLRKEIQADVSCENGGTRCERQDFRARFKILTMSAQTIKEYSKRKR